MDTVQLSRHTVDDNVLLRYVVDHVGFREVQMCEWCHFPASHDFFHHLCVLPAPKSSHMMTLMEAIMTMTSGTNKIITRFWRWVPLWHFGRFILESHLAQSPQFPRKLRLYFACYREKDTSPLSWLNDKLRDTIEWLPKSSGILHGSSLLDKSRITSDEIISMLHGGITPDI